MQTPNIPPFVRLTKSKFVINKSCDEVKERSWDEWTVCLVDLQVCNFPASSRCYQLVAFILVLFHLAVLYLPPPFFT